MCSFAIPYLIITAHYVWICSYVPLYCSLVKIISTIRPTEIYNLAAQSHVKVSFDLAEYTAEVVGVGTLRLLGELP